MSVDYDCYLDDHISNVVQAFRWLHFNIPEFSDPSIGTDAEIAHYHDASKRSSEEYKAYDEYFYGGNRSSRVVNNFKRAWLHHIHNNPHHWQYWVLQHDDAPEEPLEMPVGYVVEMIADWWSFSFKSGNLSEIFDWYEKHKEMKLHPKTRLLVERTLEEIRKRI